jgi:metal-responsive CopG/Arc/MetJ family transcriptional regulator
MNGDSMTHVGVRVPKELDDKLRKRFANDRGGRSRWYRKAVENEFKRESRGRKRGNGKTKS